MKPLLSACVLAVVLSGCKAKVLDLSGFSCDAGQCVSGYSCDAASNTCVTTGNACDSGLAQPSPCTFGATDCAGGCRFCENNQWSDCRTEGPDPTDCTPSTLSCDSSGNLVACDAAGTIESSTPCPFGCSNEASPARCNECTPSALTCLGDNLTLVTCGADGLIASQTSCETTSRCRDAGVCIPGTGCGVQGQSPTGTPCDEGAGQNGNFCDSVCNTAGNCQTTGTAPTCNDQNPCTSDSCVPATGCSNAARPVGTGCVATGTPNNPCSNSCNVNGTCQANLPVDCDDEQPCTTDQCTNAGGVAVCSHGNSPNTVECRPALGDCDAPEMCTGSAPDCPTDVFASSGECRASTGACDAAESCDGSGVDCPPDLPEPSTTVCRPSIDTVPGPALNCDPAETCPWDGVTAPVAGDFICPSDDREDNGSVCRVSTEATCDPAETCNNGVCPANGFAAAGALCGAGPCQACNAGGACNVMPADDNDCAEVDCPTDTTCRNYVADYTDAANNRCEVFGTCRDAGDCTFAANVGTVCLTGSGDVCDVDDTCDSNGDCPTNTLGNGTPCGTSCSTTLFENTCNAGTCGAGVDTGCDCNWVVTPAAGTATVGNAVNFTVDAGCTGAAADIVCTTTARQCFNGPIRFEGNTGGFQADGGAISNVGCDAATGEIPTTNCRDSDATGNDVLRINRNSHGRFTNAISAAGLSGLRLHLRAAISDEAENGEAISVRACCSTTANCTTNAGNQVGQVFSSDQTGGGSDAWCARTSSQQTCTADEDAGFNLGSGFNNCADVRIGFQWNSSQDIEFVYLDDIFFTSDVAQIPLTDGNNDGIYDGSVRICRDTTVTIECRWQGSGAVLGSANIDYNP